MMSRLMSLCEIALVSVAIFSAIYHGVTMFRLRAKMDPVPPVADARDFPSVTFWRPIKPGTPELRAKLEMLVAATRPCDQVLAGVDNDRDEAVARALPGVEVVRCEPDRAANPKVSKLLQMEPHARHEHWILSDSETLPTPDFTRGFLAQWRGCDVLTAGYGVVNARGFFSQFDAAAVLLTLWPGMVLARMRFTLGAWTGVKRDDVKAVGGWAAFADLLAEDHALGARLAAMGRSIELCRSPVALDSDAMDARSWFAHQRRVALTYRVCDSAGFFGMALTQGLTASTLLALASPLDGWRWAIFAVSYGVRLFTARANARRLGFPLPLLPLLVLGHSIAESVFWLQAWLSNRVQWAGRDLRVTRDGKIRCLP
jgi:ceramide glucosyltransferase